MYRGKLTFIVNQNSGIHFFGIHKQDAQRLGLAMQKQKIENMKLQREKVLKIFLQKQKNENMKSQREKVLVKF